MKLVGRIPVEPLDDERMTNIERRIVSGAADAAAQPQRARGHLALGFALIAMFIVGAGLVGWKLRGDRGEAQVVAATEPLRVNSDGDRATIDLGDAAITSDPRTAFVVTRPGTGVLVEMTRGKVELEVKKRGGRDPLVVRAGKTDVVVVGTHFTVDYGDGTGEVIVRVTEGVVRVVREKQEARVAAGQAWRTEQGVVAVAELPEPPRGTLARAGSGATNVEIDMGQTPDVLHDRVAQVPDVRTPPQPNPGSGSQGKSIKADQSTRPTLDPGDPKGDLKSLVRAQTVLPAQDVGETDAQKRIAKYQEIMRASQGEEHLYAFYSMAVVQAMKLDRSADALTTLDRFMRRVPTSSQYYLPALWLRVRIHCVRAIDDSCRQAAELYLRRDTDSAAGHVAQRIAE